MTPVAFCLILYGFCFFFVAGDKRSLIAALAIGRNITQRKWMLAAIGDHGRGVSQNAYQAVYIAGSPEPS